MGAPPKKPDIDRRDDERQKVVRGKKKGAQNIVVSISVEEGERFLHFLLCRPSMEKRVMSFLSGWEDMVERVKKLQDGETPTAPKCSTSLSLFLVTKGEESVQFLSSMPLATFSLFPFAVAALQGVIRNRGNELFGAL